MDGPTLSARLPVRSPALGPREDNVHELVLCLVHREGCPRNLSSPTGPFEDFGLALEGVTSSEETASEDEAPASERERDAFQDYYFSHVPPGEDHVPPRRSARRVTSVPTLLRRDESAPGRDDGFFVRLTEALHEAVRTVDGAREATAHELSSALIGIACSMVAAVDADFLPPIVLASFFPELGLSQAAALGLVRTTYAEHHRYEEELMEKERIAIDVEAAKRDAMQRLKEGN